ncbi:polyribonucleotide nucleotidyltransferase [bacterium]|nr:polyribonucleotide nucleotidyltransferase [bacterium]MBU1918216.1 polyribonucleotide nucleotidyltransferase [bacterium]
MSTHEVRCQLGNSEIIIETGKMAKQAGGSVIVRSGDSMVLVVATSAAKPKNDCDFLPLTVEYLEKSFAAGKIPGGFFKREGRPSETAILTSRFIDRPIRPLFPDHYYYDTQVITTVLSACGKNPPDMLAMIGSSAALMQSDIPFKKPIAGCRVCRIDGKLVVNPSLEEIECSDLELVVAASEDAVVMVEGGANQAKEEDLLKAITFAHESLKPVIQIQKELQAMCGKPKREVIVPETRADITEAVLSCKGQVAEALGIKIKQDRYARLDEIKEELKEKLLNDESTYAHKLQLNNEFQDVKSQLMRATILNEKKRIDERGLTDIRNISSEVKLLPRAHGSALFTRGETQALVTCTLGSGDDEQIIDGLLHEYKKRFMLNYNFPAFSVGEVKPLRSPGRREIGHGHLAERALTSLLPDGESFPYTIRIVSEILESNGSSSMATVCGGSLAMMDAGVPLKKAVAGIAMGLIKDDDKYAILSDILGDEDHLGDMDFKVTGTDEGVTAVQMDIKIEGITTEIMEKALMQAKEGRMHILGKMNETMTVAREELPEHAPKMKAFKISIAKIKDVIGPGGKIIKSIVEETGAKINIEDDGTVKIFASDGASLNKAIDLVNAYSEEVKMDTIYQGTVKKITNFGAFVEILPKTEGLLHISQISNKRVEYVEDVLREGESVRVKVINIDNMGKVKLTMKNLED